MTIESSDAWQLVSRVSPSKGGHKNIEAMFLTPDARGMHVHVIKIRFLPYPGMSAFI